MLFLILLCFVDSLIVKKHWNPAVKQRFFHNMHPSGNVENTHDLYINSTWFFKYFGINITCFEVWFFALIFDQMFNGFWDQKWGCNSDVSAPFRHLFGTLFSKTRFGRFRGRIWTQFGPMLAPFGSLFVNVGSPWVPFYIPCLHFGSLWLLLGDHLDPFGTFREHFGRPTSLVQRPILHVLAPSASTLVNIFCILAPSKNKLKITSDK